MVFISIGNPPFNRTINETVQNSTAERFSLIKYQFLTLICHKYPYRSVDLARHYFAKKMSLFFRQKLLPFWVKRKYAEMRFSCLTLIKICIIFCKYYLNCHLDLDMHFIILKYTENYYNDKILSDVLRDSTQLFLNVCLR